MANNSSNTFVKSVLKELQNINNEVDEKKEVVHKFLQTLRRFIKEDGDAILQDTTFDFGGSAYEGTAVSKVTDFDILLILPEPYIADNFVIYQRHEPGIYKLKWDDEYDKRPNFVNGKGYLEAKKLREYTINKLANSLHFLQALVTLALTAASAPPSHLMVSPNWSTSSRTGPPPPTLFTPLPPPMVSLLALLHMLGT
ncbi:hypothetical protein Pmani_006374 [Petrolisthes manimaculis]|uniref:Mab-21-like nucleotidyltransferase domain-containing protein n=1 Tax=Petrolisthes manimaculis TaxID=1843537 RepID=A0AAE1QB26_9EUCA|nr:hypothetical protein Pmani_006374 [Petrolisthes manimaculis]